MFTTIKLVSRHQNTQKYDAILPVELTNEAIRNSESYKEYYAIALGAEPPKTKASIRKKQSSSDTTMPPPTATGKRLKTSVKVGKPAKEKQHAKSSKAKDNDGDDFVHPKFSTHDEEDKDEEGFDHIVQTPSQVENTDDEDNDEDSDGINVEGDEMDDERENQEDDADELYRDVNINLEGRDIQMAEAHTTQVIEDTQVTLTPVNPEENEDFLNKLDENIQKIIKEQVKEQVKVQVSKILPKIEKTVNEQLEAKVLTHSSNLSKTSHVVATDLSKLELKKILIDKIERNKSIHISNEQKNLYKALVDAYKCDKLILDTYGDTVTLKRRRDDEDKDEEPSAGSNWGSKRRRAGKEPESTSAPKKMTSKTSGKSTEGFKSHHNTASESAPAKEIMQTTQDLEEPAHQEFETGASDDQPIKEASHHPHWFQKQTKPLTLDRAWNKTLPASHGRIQPWISNLAKKAYSRTSFNELMDTPIDFSAFMMNRLKVDTLTPELLAGQTYELMKGSCKSLVELEFFLEEVYKATSDQLD
nr:hypothetical protein [Tanacetum cinerariifolium]